MLLGILASGICRAQVFNEYQVKAAFLYSFAKFVEWPPQAFSSPSAAMTICILGEDPFGSFLDDAVRGKTVGGRPLAVYRLTDLPAGHECQILFIAASERAGCLRCWPRWPLPVSSRWEIRRSFAAQGGVIGLRLDGERIRLSVNLTAAEKAKLRISSRVLSLATIVR